MRQRMQYGESGTAWHGMAWQRTEKPSWRGMASSLKNLGRLTVMPATVAYRIGWIACVRSEYAYSARVGRHRGSA